tara:strand:+ start:132 stop:560 length:429 start_codon:yes stop_codon:yes gene_type:complete
MITSTKSKFIKKPPTKLITDITRAMGFNQLLYLYKNTPFTLKDLQMRNVLCSVSPYLEELNTYYQEENKINIQTFNYQGILQILDDILEFKKCRLYRENVKVKRRQKPYQKFHIVKPDFFIVSDKTDQEVKAMKNQKFVVEF